MAFGALQSAKIFNKLKQKPQLILTAAVTKNATVPQNYDTVLLKRDPSEIPFDALSDCDMIGPPHPVSNLRRVIWYRAPIETVLKKKLRDLQEETQEWNQRFWEAHNSNFIRERKNYIEKHSPGGDAPTLTADEMSEFYKEFLDKNWKNHVTYNFLWYRRNFAILFLSIMVNVESLFQRS